MTLERPGRALLVGALILLARVEPAQADCAAPLSYGITYSGREVYVCAGPSYERVCPGDGLLRVDASGEAVLITTCDDQQCFVDECVPPGSYQYGLRTPFACCPSCCGTDYYGVAEPAAGVAGCQRTIPAPASYGGALPWGTSLTICGYQGQSPRAGGGGCGSSGSGPVLAFNAAVLLLGLVLWRARSQRTAPPP